MNQAERIEKLKENKAEIRRLENVFAEVEGRLKRQERNKLRKGCTHETASGRSACKDQGFAGVDCMICLENF